MALAGLPAPALAQQVYGPAEPSEPDDAGAAPAASDPCATEVRDDGAIVVCRELPDAERYRSPLPRPVQSDRPVIAGLTDPPCWVTDPASVGTPACIRVGWAPPPVIMVDFDQFPEDLSEADAALVSAAPDDRAPSVASGQRVPIDLSGD